MGKSKAAKVQVPECRYGSACTRRDCIFRHPPKQERQQAPQQEKSDKICFSFVAGRCAFGRLCHDRHPDEVSCRTIQERYARIDCQWGKGCRTEGCLYRHPSDEVVGPAMPVEAPKPQPAVYAEGPKIVPQAIPEDVRWKTTNGAGDRQAWGTTPGWSAWRPGDGPAEAPLEQVRASARTGAGGASDEDSDEGAPRTGPWSLGSMPSAFESALPGQDRRRPGAQEGASRSSQPSAAPPTGPEDDAEERAREEQLAAMLRCMGFDEEPSLHAASRAGGNLNLAVETALQSRGGPPS